MNKKSIIITIVTLILINISVMGQNLEESFNTPPDSVKPWVFWFWINGNISHEGITKDLEAMKAVGINGVMWMEVSGPWWAPQGKIEAGSKEWHDAMQWAISEADRLGMEFGLSVDFGYGYGNGYNDQRSTHGRRAGFAQVGLGAILPDELTNLHGAQFADHPRS